MKIIKITALCFFLPLLAWGQGGRWKITSTTVSESGWRQMQVPPSLRELGSSDFSDLRLHDTAGTEIPYVLKIDRLSTTGTKFNYLPILERKITSHNTLVLELGNEEGSILKELFFKAAHSDVKKFCSVSGSSDRKQWYAVSSETWMEEMNGDTGATSYLHIQFPPINYKFLQIQIKDSAHYPIQIDAVGNFRGSETRGKLLELSGAALDVQSFAKDKYSLLHVSFKNTQCIDVLQCQIASPAFYKREATLLVKRSAGKNGRSGVRWIPVQSFQLSSALPSMVYLMNFCEKEFQIRIMDYDNPPLVIPRVVCKQLEAVVIANLEKGKKYIMSLGDPNAQMPVYDQSSFLPAHTDSLPHLEFDNVPSRAAENSAAIKKGFWQSPLFLWVCIIASGLVLTFFSIRLIRDLKKQS